MLRFRFTKNYKANQMAWNGESNVIDDCIVYRSRVIGSGIVAQRRDIDMMAPTMHCKHSKTDPFVAMNNLFDR